jgi:hypothetical protein
MTRKLKQACLLLLPIAVALATSQASAATQPKPQPKKSDKVYTHSIANTKFDTRPASSVKTAKPSSHPPSTAQQARTAKHQKAVPASDAKAFTAQGARPSHEILRQSNQPTAKASASRQANDPDGPETSVGDYGQTVYHSVHDWSPGSLNRDPAATRTASKRTREPQVRGQSPRERAVEVDDRR